MVKSTGWVWVCALVGVGCGGGGGSGGVVAGLTPVAPVVSLQGVPGPTARVERNTRPVGVRTGLGGNGHAETWDGRVFVVTRGGAPGGGAGWFAMVFRPEVLQRGASGAPVFSAATRSAPVLLEGDAATQTGMTEHNALAIMPASGFEENPFRSDASGAPQVGGAFETYEFVVVTQRYTADPADTVLGRRRGRVVVRDPRSAGAEVASASMSSGFEELETVGGRRLVGIEPTLTFDRRLLIWQGHPDNDGKIDVLVYSVNADPDARVGWSEPRALPDLYHVDRNRMLAGVVVHERFPLAKEPLRAADGRVYGRGELLRGAYPWISHDGTELFYDAVVAGIPGVNRARRGGLSVIGRWTGNVARHVDGPVNPDREAGGQSPPTVRLFFSSPGAVPGFWAPFPDVREGAIPYTSRRPVYPLFGSNTDDYNEVSFEDHEDGDYVLVLRMNELVTFDGAIDVGRTADTSGNVFTGVLEGARFPQEYDGVDANLGAVGQGVYVGDADRVRVAHGGGLATPEAVTVSLFVRRLVDLSGDPVDRARAVAHLPGSWRVVVEEDGRVRVEVEAGGRSAQVGPVGPALALNRWTHVAFRYEAGSGEVRVWIDGVGVGGGAAGPGAVGAPSGDLVLGPGGAHATAPQVPAGHPVLMLDEVRVSRVGRTDAEIAAEAYADRVLPEEVRGGLDLPLGFDARDLRIPATNPVTQEAVALGQRLFEDTGFSPGGTVGCVTCHLPGEAFTDGVSRSLDVRGQPVRRNSQTVLQRAFGERQFFDGRAASLEAQVVEPFVAEMGTTVAAVVQRLRGDPSYVYEFQLAYGEGPSEVTVARALASFVRAQVWGEAPEDRFAAGDRGALTPAQQRGRVSFFGKARCSACHGGPNFTDESFHDTALTTSTDRGRGEATGRARDEGRFKTPTLRDVALTAPYFHDGSVPSLAEVVRLYNEGGLRQVGRDPEMRPLELSGQEQAELVAYLEALTSTKAAQVTARGTVPTRAAGAARVEAPDPPSFALPQALSPAFRAEQERYAAGLFQIYVGRAAGAGEVDAYVDAIYRGSSRRAAVEVLLGTDPVLEARVEEGYRRVLGRGVDPGGLQTYRGVLAGGATRRAFWLTLLGSGEFQSAHASDGDYVEGCYGAILQRAADAGGLASYTDALGRGALTRRGVAEALLGSEEYFQREIERAYQEFLGRAPDASGRAGALAGLQSGQSVEAMRAGVAASQEAFDRLK